MQRRAVQRARWCVGLYTPLQDAGVGVGDAAGAAQRSAAQCSARDGASACIRHCRPPVSVSETPRAPRRAVQRSARDGASACIRHCKTPVSVSETPRAQRRAAQRRAVQRSARDGASIRQQETDRERDSVSGRDAAARRCDVGWRGVNLFLIVSSVERLMTCRVSSGRCGRHNGASSRLPAGKPRPDRPCRRRRRRRRDV